MFDYLQHGYSCDFQISIALCVWMGLHDNEMQNAPANMLLREFLGTFGNATYIFYVVHMLKGIPNGGFELRCLISFISNAQCMLRFSCPGQQLSTTWLLTHSPWWDGERIRKVKVGELMS